MKLVSLKKTVNSKIDNAKKGFAIYYFSEISNLLKTFIYFVLMKLRRILSAVLLIHSGSVYSQVGGNNTYEFLNFSNSARIAAMGGNTIAIKDNDIIQASQNPALLNAGMDKALAFTYVNYFTDINYGYTAFGKKISKKGTLGVGLQYLNYGKFTKTDPTGESTGTFTAGEYALNIGSSSSLP